MVLITLIKTKNNPAAVTDEHFLQPLKSQPEPMLSKTPAEMGNVVFKQGY